MEGLYGIHVTPASLIEPNPIGYVLGADEREARRRAARVMRIGFRIHASPRWAPDEPPPWWTAEDEAAYRRDGRLAMDR